MVSNRKQGTRIRYIKFHSLTNTISAGERASLAHPSFSRANWYQGWVCVAPRVGVCGGSPREPERSRKKEGRRDCKGEDGKAGTVRGRVGGLGCAWRVNKRSREERKEGTARGRKVMLGM